MRVAAVDIGTNSMRLLIAESSGEAFEELVRRTVVTTLGRGVDATGVLDADAVERTLNVLSDYGNQLETLGVTSVRAVATSATRDAANADEFLSAAEKALGFAPELISGSDEAKLAFTGATMVTDSRPAVVIDLGGGSTEFVYGEEAPSYVRSIDIGSVRLTERVLPDRPASADGVAAARAHAERLLGEVVLPGTPAEAIGVAGTFTSLSAINLDLERYDVRRVHGSVLAYSDLLSLVDFLAAMTVEETASLPSLDPARAPVILGGAVVALSCLSAIDVERVVVSEQDLLQGILVGLVAEDT